MVTGWMLIVMQTFQKDKTSKMNLVLRNLDIHDEKAFREGLEAFSEMELSWYSFIWKPDMSFQELLDIQRKKTQGIDIPEGRVPDSMLYAFVDGKIIGRSSIRHELNDHLFKLGGHIGYAVAPAYRQKGYATEILKQSLDFCRNVLNLDRVLVTCDDDNLASIKTIEKISGILENKIKAKDEDVLTRRYWINLKG